MIASRYVAELWNAVEKYRRSERDEQGDIYSNGFYEFYIMLASSEYPETADQSALMVFVPKEE